MKEEGSLKPKRKALPMLEVQIAVEKKWRINPIQKIPMERHIQIMSF